MVVEFSIKRVPKFRVASIVRVGPWKEDNLRSEFRELTAWARGQEVRTGRWIFFERDRNRWEACLELKGPAEVGGRVRLKTLPPTWAACVTFDPDAVSSRVVYHALNDWLRWRRKDGTIKSVTGVREVYDGDPWASRKAWAHCTVQFLVRK
jgi:hypothetical protein